MNDYDKIGLVPRVTSQIRSRSDVNTSSKFCKSTINIPIVASPMVDVAGIELLRVLSNLGGFGFLHRFQEIEKQKCQFERCKYMGFEVGAAIGIKNDERFDALYDSGCRYFLVDTANGANSQVGETIKKLLTQDEKWIAGNVASGEGFQYLCDCGYDAVRVGIAGGQACTTRYYTGVYQNYVKLIEECYKIKVANNYEANIIADGGIKKPEDLCKALGLGANQVMLGSILASCKESPAKTYKIDGKLKKAFRGSSSYSVQTDNGKEPTFTEGTEILLDYAGNIEEVLKSYTNGLKSCMSYHNAYSLDEFRKNCTYEYI